MDGISAECALRLTVLTGILGNSEASIASMSGSDWGTRSDFTVFFFAICAASNSSMRRLRASSRFSPMTHAPARLAALFRSRTSAHVCGRVSRYAPLRWISHLLRY
jgi:hypothetical protein